MSSVLTKIPFKSVWRAHPSITGSLVGLLFGFLLGGLNVPGALFFIAPFLAGLLAGFLGGSGAKAGVLTLLLPILVMIAIPIVFPSVDWTASTMPEVEGVGPINATLAALTNGLIRSTWGITQGLAAAASVLAGVLFLVFLIMLPILVAIGVVITAVLGFIGGKIGGVVHARYRSQETSVPQSSPYPTQQSTVPLRLSGCPICANPINNADARYCPRCGAPLVESGTPQMVSPVITSNT